MENNELNYKAFAEWIKKGAEIRAFDIASSIHSELLEKGFKDYFKKGKERGYIEENDIEIAHHFEIREAMNRADMLFIIGHLVLAYETSIKSNELKESSKNEEISELLDKLMKLL